MKLAALLGLLVGLPGVVVAVWLAAVSGGLMAALLMLLRRKGRKDAIPFAPFLSLGAMVALLVGGELLDYYRELAGNVGGLLS